MPTTRRQAAIAEGKISPKGKTEHPEHRTEDTSTPKTNQAPSKTPKPKTPNHETSKQADGDSEDTRAEVKRTWHEDDKGVKTEEPSAKRTKTSKSTSNRIDSVYKSGTIEQGHIYFFYRPRVELEEAHSVDDIKNFHILLVPRPPAFSQAQTDTSNDTEKRDPAKEEKETKVLADGADAVPAAANRQTNKFYRLITVGKKKLPDPEKDNCGGGRRNEMFWATVTAIGEDLDSLEAGLEAKSYETKTRGTRHEEPARLVARGGYAIVNSDAETLSQRETHLGYHVSHPNPKEQGDVQLELGIYSASSFVLQIRNPLAPASGSQTHAKPVEYPDWIMNGVFRAGGESEGRSKGRESFGLRFSSCETPELLNYKNAQLLLIAAREGEEGLEESLGSGRGTALSDAEEKEGRESLKSVFEELGLDLNNFPVESLKGSWI